MLVTSKRTKNFTLFKDILNSLKMATRLSHVSHAKHDLAQRNNPPYQKYAQSEDEKCQGGERNCRLPIADLAPLNWARLVEKSKTYEEHRSVKLDFFG